MNLDGDGPNEVLMEGELDGNDMLVIADPYRSGAVRTFVFGSVAPEVREPIEPFMFRRVGQVYVGWTDGERTVAVHFDDRGLIREVVGP